MHTVLMSLLVVVTSLTLHGTAFPPQQPTDVDANYRSGQTFVTWTENAGVAGESYRIYRADHPISSANLAGATLLYEVGENSARFYENRYRDYSSPPVWRDRYVENYVIADQGSELAAGTGLLVWTLAPADFGGGSSGDGYYAVTTVLDGVENVTDFSGANTAGPVAESIAAPEPVALSGDGSWHAYIQYMDLADWNPTFHAPRSYNDYYGVDPATAGITQSVQYAYDYAVFVPGPSQCGGELPDTLPVLLELHAWQGNVYPPPSSAVALCAYVIHPFDVSETWWFGFARDYDFRLGGRPGAGDTIANYTEQRVLRMIGDLIRTPVGPAVDSERIYVKGHSMGASGALALALRYPDVFAAAYASKPMTDYRQAGGWIGSVAAKWGSLGIRVAGGVGRAVWVGGPLGGAQRRECVGLAEPSTESRDAIRRSDGALWDGSRDQRYQHTLGDPGSTRLPAVERQRPALGCAGHGRCAQRRELSRSPAQFADGRAGRSVCRSASTAQ